MESSAAKSAASEPSTTAATLIVNQETIGDERVRRIGLKL